MSASLRTPTPRDAIIAPGQTWQSIGRDVTSLAIDRRIGLRWWLAFLAALGLTGLMGAAIAWLFFQGVGVWGNNIPVTWALDIVSYDWWIGIASGGLVVSATLLLFDSQWRGALNRITETMALVAACAAGVYPIIHLGRPWFFFWIFPYPNTYTLYPQVRSPLFWDGIDIISYILLTLAFWYVGLLPDLAAMRDQAIARLGSQRSGLPLLRAQIYGIACLGWRGSTLHWARWIQAYRTLALLGILLVISLQTCAAVMYAGTVEPGWHDTLLPTAFVFGAIYSGVAMVCLLAVLLRSVFGLAKLVTPRHLDILGMLLLALGVMNLYCEAAEFLTGWLTGDSFGRALLARRFHGDHAWATWTMILLSLVPVHLLWFPALRRSALLLALVGLLTTIGIYADHFMIIVITLQHDFLPSAAQTYRMDLWGIVTFAGSVGLFVVLLLLFLRYLPAVSLVELRRLVAGLPHHG